MVLNYKDLKDKGQQHTQKDVPIETIPAVKEGAKELKPKKEEPDFLLHEKYKEEK